MPLMTRGQFPKAVLSTKAAKSKKRPIAFSTKVDDEAPKRAAPVESTRVDGDDGDTTVSQAVPMASRKKRGRGSYA